MALPAYCIGLLVSTSMTLYAQLQLRRARLSYLDFSNDFSINIFRNFSSKCGHPNFCGNYILHPVSKGERGHPSWLLDGRFVGL